MSDEAIDADTTLAEVERAVYRARLSEQQPSTGEPTDRPTSELRTLLAEARRGEGHQRPRWEAARRGLDTLMKEVHDDLTHLAIVQTSADERVMLRSWVGWGGDTLTVLAAGATSADRSAQAVEVGAEARRRLHRMRLLAVVLAAAPRVAALFTTPGGAALALPAAWRLVQSIREAHGIGEASRQQRA